MSELIRKELNELLIEQPWSDGLPEQYEVFEEGDWTDAGKYEDKSDVIKHLPSGTFYIASFFRPVDYWRGYETECTAVQRCKPKLVERIEFFLTGEDDDDFE